MLPPRVSFAPYLLTALLAVLSASPGAADQAAAAGSPPPAPIAPAL